MVGERSSRQSPWTHVWFPNENSRTRVVGPGKSASGVGRSKPRDEVPCEETTSRHPSRLATPPGRHPGRRPVSPRPFHCGRVYRPPRPFSVRPLGWEDCPFAPGLSTIGGLDPLFTPLTTPGSGPYVRSSSGGRRYCFHKLRGITRRRFTFSGQLVGARHVRVLSRRREEPGGSPSVSVPHPGHSVPGLTRAVLACAQSRVYFVPTPHCKCVLSWCLWVHSSVLPVSTGTRSLVGSGTYRLRCSSRSTYHPQCAIARVQRILVLSGSRSPLEHGSRRPVWTRTGTLELTRLDACPHSCLRSRSQIPLLCLCVFWVITLTPLGSFPPLRVSSFISPHP